MDGSELRAGDTSRSSPSGAGGSGPLGTSDLTELYREIIKRNLQLKELIEGNAEEDMVLSQKSLLQQAVDGLLDNDRASQPILDSSNRRLKSLTNVIASKPLNKRSGKRVDFSCGSVAVVDPSLELHQFGLPFEIAVKLYHPFIIRRMIELGRADSIETAERMLERPARTSWPFRTRFSVAGDELRDILDEVVIGRPILLSRPHQFRRAAIQAFEPKIVTGKAIRIHPLICRGFDIEFGGEQLNVHLPLSIEAQTEAMTLMLATNILFSPSNGELMITPSRDVVMGCHYATIKKPDLLGDGMIFASTDEVHTAFLLGMVAHHSVIKVRMPKYKRVKGEGADEYGSFLGPAIETSVGRVLFNDVLPAKMPFYNQTMAREDLVNVVGDCFFELGRGSTITLLDRIKNYGLHESTRSGLSFACSDLKTPDDKSKVIAAAERRDQKAKASRKRRVHCERALRAVLDTWTNASKQIKIATVNASRMTTATTGPTSIQCI